MSAQNSTRPRAEQKFFEDPAIDRLMGTVMALATEVFVLQSRLRTLEDHLDNSEILDADVLRRTHPDPQQLASAAKDYSEHLMRPILGLQDAAGPTD